MTTFGRDDAPGRLSTASGPTLAREVGDIADAGYPSCK